MAVIESPARNNNKLTRRVFIRYSAAGTAGFMGSLLLSERLTRPAVEKLVEFSLPTPWYKGKVTTTYNYCDMCPWRCGIIVKSVDGRVAKIEGNPKDPKSRGMLCAKGQAGVSFLYDPDRLKQPMIRTGERGEGKFKTVSWQEALDYSAQKLNQIKEKYGPESVAFFGHGTGDFWFTDYLPQAWGSPNGAKPSVSLCTTAREEAALLTFGRTLGNHEPVDWEKARCVVFLGSHLGEDARNTMMQDFANAKARGMKVIVVDPRYSTIAMKADYWLPIKPGTDTALLMAWMNVLITEKLYDRDFVQQWTVGFERVVSHVAPFTPEWATKITELPADLIRQTALELGHNRPQAQIIPGRHVAWYGNDTQRMRAVYIIDALLGALGQPGGMYFNKPPYLEENPHPPYAVQGGAGG